MNPLLESLAPFGPFTDLKMIGKGAFSIIFKAFHQEKQQLVALKVFTTKELDEEFSKRFLREIELLKKMTHPFIIALYETGTTAIAGLPHQYIVLEHFEGDDLQVMTTLQGCFSWQEVLLILYQCAQALNYMHNQKILHRDLNPSNIMYSQEKKTAKIIDLGLGKCLRDADEDITKHDVIWGTLNFMPVEQWVSLHEVTEKTDIYSLGATAYFLLSGKNPYGETEDAMEICRNVINKKLSPLKDNLSSPVPDPFLNVVLKMMAYDPKHRYSNTNEVLQLLEKIAKNFDIKLS